MGFVLRALVSAKEDGGAAATELFQLPEIVLRS